MSIIPHFNENDHDLNTSVSRFIKEYKIGRLPRACRAEKEKGIPAIAIFQYLLCLTFADRSMYMQIKTNTFRASFSKNTVYRFLNSAKTNWLRFTTTLSEMVENQFMRNLTSNRCEDAFIIDDTLYARAGHKKSELVSNVFDHVTMKYKRGSVFLPLAGETGIRSFPSTLPCPQVQRKKMFSGRTGSLTNAPLPAAAGNKPSQMQQMSLSTC